ncbi:hypothetical protein TNCV_1899471 [Trichonephila clavipes]|nr:hypothetical protein TNCV_1899471 [Trichonephila clavipes]
MNRNHPGFITRGQLALPVVPLPQALGNHTFYSPLVNSTKKTLYTRVKEIFFPLHTRRVETENELTSKKLLLLTNHKCLKSQLFHIDIADSLDCTLSDSRQAMATESLDVDCAINGFDMLREKYCWIVY